MRAVPSRGSASLLFTSLAWLLAALALLSAACTKDSRTGPGPARDAGSSDLGAPDLGELRCTSAAQCDDGFACTLDGCGVSGACTHTSIDAMCAMGESCVVGTGCIRRGGTACTGDADCDDGNFCNGTERCVGRTCVMPIPEDCDDGNACTVDTCDVSLDRCVRETAPGCDAGVAPGDAGAGPFEAPRDYAGRFLLVPAQSSGCGAATYSISSVSFSAGASALTVTAGSFPLAQSPVPGGASFDASYVQPGCGTYRLQGTFSNSDSFMGTWTADFSGGGGSCGLCPGMSSTVVGVRTSR